MASKTPAAGASAGRPDAASQREAGSAQREQLIREAAYYQYVRRGYVPGHDLDDWLAAEAELFGPPGEEPASAPADASELEIQQSSARGAWRDDAIKRIVRQHPQEGIPKVESVEAREAPPKE